MDDNAKPPPISRQLLGALRRGLVGILRLVREILRHLRPALVALWRVARPILRTILQMLSLIHI